MHGPAPLLGRRNRRVGFLLIIIMTNTHNLADVDFLPSEPPSSEPDKAAMDILEQNRELRSRLVDSRKKLDRLIAFLHEEGYEDKTIDDAVTPPARYGHVESEEQDSGASKGVSNTTPLPGQSSDTIGAEGSDESDSEAESTGEDSTNE